MNFDIRKRAETFQGEGLKTLAERSLHHLARSRWTAEHLLSLGMGGRRVEDECLYCEVAGLHFENPLMVGPGWDKRGWAVDGLYALGFSGVEVGSVLVHPQVGNPKPRLFTDSSHSVSLNRLGFNSVGMEAVAANLDQQRRSGIVGISLGKNRLTPDQQAPQAHADVAERLYAYADYLVINVASPNTPGLRDLLKNPEPLTNIIRAVKEVLKSKAVLKSKGEKPLFVKTVIDLDLEDLDRVLEVCLAEGVTGVIDTNTSIDDKIKACYGWAGQMGGVAGNDAQYRSRATDRMKYITRSTQGTGFQRIGVGGINSAATAMERIRAGAQLLQVVTAIREHKGRTASTINQGLLDLLQRDGVKNIGELVGVDV